MSEEIERLLAAALEATRADNLVEARNRLSEALRLARSGGEPLQLAKVLRQFGELERHCGNPIEARSAYVEAVDLLRQHGPRLRFAHAIRHLADIHREKGDVAEAAKCYDEALSIYFGSDEAAVLDVANAVRGMAILQETNGDLGEAGRLWEKARGLYGQAEIPAGMSESARRLALLAWHRGDGDAARELLGEAIAAAERSNDPAILDRVAEARRTMSM